MALKIGSNLGRYAHLAPPDLLVRQALSTLLSQELHVKVPISRIALVRGVLTVDASPLVKNEIALRKELLLTALALEFKEKSPRDVR
ncbi:MAG: hypothetical protein A2542_00865 [Parcubacteria group bacterium RIFOXYD2_FULL_52_8]|nr:MAG: hypothetical protein A2542_00865 [Parcubacteria group bacterium RIFOXYD2_FULL_52_8]